MLKYKQNIMQALRMRGYTRTKLRVTKTLGEGTMTLLTQNDCKPTADVINKLCALLDCQPGDLLEYVPDPADLPDGVAADSSGE